MQDKTTGVEEAAGKGPGFGPITPMQLVGWSSRRGLSFLGAGGAKEDEGRSAIGPTEGVRKLGDGRFKGFNTFLVSNEEELKHLTDALKEFEKEYFIKLGSGVLPNNIEVNGEFTSFVDAYFSGDKLERLARLDGV